MRTLLRAIAFVLVATPAACFAVQPTPTPPPLNYGWMLTKMLLVLGGVCVVAWVSLRWGIRRFVAPNSAASGAMRVVARLPVEPRRAILVVEVAGQTLLLGSSEAGLQKLAELDSEQAGAFDRPEAAGSDFRSVLNAALGVRNVSRETLSEEQS